MKKVNAAIVGCGRISEHYKKILLSKKIKNIKIIATCDINSLKAKKLANIFKCNYYSSINKLVKENQLDLIFLLTPSCTLLLWFFSWLLTLFL